MVANPCLLCLSSNSHGGNERKISSILNLVRSDKLTNDVPRRDDRRFVFCHDCDKLLDSATLISNSISQLQIQLKTEITNIRAIILKSEKNFGDCENNLNVEISKTRNSFLECSGNEEKTAFSEIQEITTEQEVEVDYLESNLIWQADENIGHDPLSPTSASFPETNNEMEIGQTEIKIEILEDSGNENFGVIQKETDNVYDNIPKTCRSTEKAADDESLHGLISNESFNRSVSISISSSAFTQEPEILQTNNETEIEECGIKSEISEDDYVIEVEPINKRRFNPSCELDSKDNFKGSQMKSVSSPTIQNIVRKQTKVQMMLNKTQKSTGSRTNLNFTPAKVKFSMNKERQLLHSNAFICTTCKKLFDGKLELEAHITAKHKTDEGFHCDICKCRFGQKIDLERHMDQHGYEERTFVCENCNRRYTNQNNLDAHIEIMHRLEIPQKKESKKEDKPFSCSECAKSFTFEMNLKRHLKLHTFEETQETQSIICEKCDGRFKDQDALDLHKLKRHNESVHCQYCQKEFVTFGALYYHLRLHTRDKRYSCPNCPELFFNDLAKQRHIEKVHQKDQKHPCNLCDAQFDTSIDLRSHLLRHEGKGYYLSHVCGECGKKFREKSSLESHQVKVHRKDPVICDECGSHFVNEPSLKIHKNQFHTSKIYQCDTCPKSFRSSKNLKSHQWMHTNKRPFICSFCGAGFTTAGVLTTHEKKIHSLDYTPTYNFSCPDCDKRFQTKRDMEGHIRFAHTGERPFACQQPNCDKSYCVKTALDLHLKRVHGISQQSSDKYLCPNCDKQFWVKSDMDRHIRRMHTGEKPFVCQQPNCDRKYFDKKSLNDHLKKIHGIACQQPPTSRAPSSKRDNFSSPSSSAGTKRKREQDQNSQDSSLNVNDLNEMEH